MLKVFGHFLKVLLAAGLAGLLGWAALIALSFFRVTEQFESLTGVDSDKEFARLWAAAADLILSLKGGVVMFFAAAVACIPLSEIFKSRSLLYYVGATGALTALIAAAASSPAGSEPGVPGTAAASLFALAGVVSGAVYWVIAARNVAR